MKSLSRAAILAPSVVQSVFSFEPLCCACLACRSLQIASLPPRFIISRPSSTSEDGAREALLLLGAGEEARPSRSRAGEISDEAKEAGPRGSSHLEEALGAAVAVIPSFFAGGSDSFKGRAGPKRGGYRHGARGGSRPSSKRREVSSFLSML